MLNFISVLLEYGSVCNYLEFFVFWQYIPCYNKWSFPMPSHPKLDLNELANCKYVIWKKRRMLDSKSAAPWLFVPFENSKGTFK